MYRNMMGAIFKNNFNSWCQYLKKCLPFSIFPPHKHRRGGETHTLPLPMMKALPNLARIPCVAGTKNIPNESCREKKGIFLHSKFFLQILWSLKQLKKSRRTQKGRTFPNVSEHHYFRRFPVFARGIFVF
jgi:hypothetical protein